jgi:hypothetical protein
MPSCRLLEGMTEDWERRAPRAVRFCRRAGDGLARYHELGVGDCSMMLGHDDRSAHRTHDVLTTEVLPDLGW